MDKAPLIAPSNIQDPESLRPAHGDEFAPCKCCAWFLVALLATWLVIHGLFCGFSQTYPAPCYNDIGTFAMFFCGAFFWTVLCAPFCKGQNDVICCILMMNSF